MTNTVPANQSRIKTFMNTPVARLLAVVWIVLVGFAAHSVYSHLHPSKFEGARTAADTFLTAYESCDGQTAKKYYVPFQTDAQTLSAYQAQCKKGAIHFTYFGAGTIADKLQNGEHILSIGYVYTASQTGGMPAKFVVTMRYNYKLQQWTVDSISAAPTASQQQPSQRARPQSTPTP
jgi:hypothetical protein